jgi:DNA-binding NtrC family response regulator
MPILISRSVPSRILVVDDDAALRRALVRMLRPADVVLASSAEEALELLSTSAFDAILTDYGIGPMDGVALLDQASKRCPNVRRYLMSGFDAARFAPHVTSGLIKQFFPKPLALVALRSEIRGDAS